MKQISMIIFIAMFFASAAFAEITKLDPVQRKNIQAATYRQLHSVKELPPGVVALYADNNGRLADPGQKWQVTDVINDESLPQKRLIWAAVSHNYYVVHYERGGYAHSFHVLLIEFHAKPKVVWHGAGFNKLNNFNAFKKALGGDELDDRLNYAK